jgi:hypothetical protein
MGIYELLFAKEQNPISIVINEAIIQSKIFNNKESDNSFVSGVLSAVFEASDINEEERGTVKKEFENKYGFLPYYIEDGKILFALVYNIYGK